MGKNQAYKAMQRARVGSSSGGPDEVEDGMVDGSFHSPEWHAARLASLKTSHTITWEEFKQKQKEDRLRSVDLDNDADKMMRDYRAQLDAERAHKLAHGRNHTSSSSSLNKHIKTKSSSSSSSKTRRQRKHSSSKTSRRRSGSSDSDDPRKSTTTHSNNSKKHKSKPTNHDADGPVPLSTFFNTS